MMDAIYLLFGQGRDLDPLQMSLRAVLVFLIALVLIRVSGRRSFGQRSPFDSVVVILLGATLSRAIVGASPFVATVLASLVIVVCHRLLAWICMRAHVRSSGWWAASSARCTATARSMRTNCEPR